MGKWLWISVRTIKSFEQYLRRAEVIVWNSTRATSNGLNSARTKEIGRFLGEVNCIKIAGGGETSATIHKFKLSHNFTHVSTGGGASLDFLSGKKMLGIDALQENYRKDITRLNKSLFLYQMYLRDNLGHLTYKMWKNK